MRSSEVQRACDPQRPAEAGPPVAGGILAVLRVEAGSGLGRQEARLTRYGMADLRAAEPVPLWLKLRAPFPDVPVLLPPVVAGGSSGRWLYEGEAGRPCGRVAIGLRDAATGYVQPARAGRAVARAIRTSLVRARHHWAGGRASG